MSRPDLPRAFGREAFGDDPAAYDAVRPAYPDWVFDELAARGALGPGTGGPSAPTARPDHAPVNPGARWSVTASIAVICSRSV